MDAYTESHLDHWLDSFEDTAWADAIKPRLVAQFDTDPEFYGMAGWWRVFDALETNP